jgi:hypothetical protein
VTDAVLLAPTTAAEPGGIRVLRTPGEYVPLQGSKRLHLSATLEYELVQTDDPDRGPWKVSTRKYMYHVVTDDHMEVILFHWHPGSEVPYPHMHLGSSQLRANAVVGSADHIPTGRVSFESVLGYMIQHQGVVPRRGDYLAVLAENNDNFTKWRTWSAGVGVAG